VPISQHRAGTGDRPNRACNETSVRRLATLRVQRRTPGQRVAKNCHVRRQLRRPHSFPRLRPVLHETAQSCAQAPSLPRSTAEIRASLTPIIFITPTVSKYSDELGLDCVKTGAGEEQKTGWFFGASIARLTSQNGLPVVIQSLQQHAQAAPVAT
jgi:hypothetical protein